MTRLLFVISLIFLVVENAWAQDEQQGLQDQVTALTREVSLEGPHFTLVGKIEGGHNSQYSVNGEDFETDEKTEELGGKAGIGTFAEVNGSFVEGRKVADKIVIKDDHDAIDVNKAKPLGRDSSQNLPAPSGAIE